MNADLERLIALQRLDTATLDAERRLADAPERERALDARLDAARQRVTTAKEHLTANQNARRTIEKDVAVHQGRLSKFREQAMAVKTNQEYHAIQHEMAFAQAEIKTREDQILELMVQADELTADVKRADAALAAEQKAVEADRKSIALESSELKAALERFAGERQTIVAGITAQVLVIFEQVAKRRGGVAVAQARDGICTICHVRMRPQVFNTVRRNDEIVQCEHCQRILFYVPVATDGVVAAPRSDGGPGNSENNNAASTAAR
jgi:predicted  nucleic acid-binding Zn-ribbon protein